MRTFVTLIRDQFSPKLFAIFTEFIIFTCYFSSEESASWTHVMWSFFEVHARSRDRLLWINNTCFFPFFFLFTFCQFTGIEWESQKPHELTHQNNLLVMRLTMACKQSWFVRTELESWKQYQIVTNYITHIIIVCTIGLFLFCYGYSFSFVRAVWFYSRQRCLDWCLLFMQ